MRYFLSLILFMACAQALILEDLISKARLEATFKNKKVGFYVGSFDPLHKGHEKLARLPIENGVCDYVIIYPAWGGDSFKDRVDVSVRQDMIFAAFADHPTVIVTRLSPQDLQSLLTKPTLDQFLDDKALVKPAFEGLEFIGITGSDSALAYKDSKASRIFMRGILITEKYRNHTVGGIMALPAKSFVLGVREGDDVSSLRGIIAERPIIATVSDNKTHNFSSSLVKKEIAAGKSIKDMVSPDVAKIIDTKGLYRGQ